MLMAAATQIVGSASAHSSISPPTPWHPVLLVPNHNHHQVLYDHLATPSPSSSPTTPATASPACHNHEQHLRPASRQRPGKPRRPRPSRKLPTTYIRTDATGFQRMVHQVTGADDDVPLLHLHGAAAAPGPELLYRHAPAPHSRAAGLTTTTTKTDTLLLLPPPPTLDTSAFLMLGAAAGVGGSRGGAKPARPPGVSCCHGSSVVVDPGVVVQVKTEEGCSGAGDGFPSLESWDDEDGALFYD